MKTLNRRTNPSARRRLPVALLLISVISVFLLATSCAHTASGRKRQKIAIASAAAAIVLVIGLAVLAGTATDCEDTGNCNTPQRGITRIGDAGPSRGGGDLGVPRSIGPPSSSLH